MRSINLFAFVLVIIITSLGPVTSQVSTMLAMVTEGSPNNSAGLGVTFTNRVMPDGDLYFRGSKDGLTEAIWRTDGTVAGTRKIIEEGSAFGGSWSTIYFVEDGILLEGNDGYKFLSDEDNQLSDVPTLPADFLRGFSQTTSGQYVFMTEVNDMHTLYVASSDFSTVQEVADIHPDGSEIVAYGGSKGALVYNGNAFQESFPVVYEYETESVTPLGEYMAGYDLTLSDMSEGYVHGDFMFLSYRDADNFFRDHVINMATGEVAEFTFLRAPYTVHEYGDKLVFVASRDAIVFDPADLSHQFLYEDVLSLGTSRVVGDKLYFIAKDDENMEQVAESDLTTATFRFLPGASTGLNFYNCRMLDYQGDFYYLSEDEHVALMKYDFATESPVFVDTLSVVTGATVVHDIVEVSGDLVFSKRLGFLQHEPFVLGNGGSTSTSRLALEELIVAPTVATDIVTILASDVTRTGQVTVQIYNISGKSYGVHQLQGQMLDVSDLPEGRYFGILSTDDKDYKITFVKM